VVERAPLGVDQATLAKVVHVLELVAVEASGNIDPFAPNNDDSLALEQLLGDDGCQTAQKMTSTIDDERFGGETHLESLKFTEYA